MKYSWNRLLSFLSAAFLILLSVHCTTGTEDPNHKVENEAEIRYTVEGSSGAYLVRKADGFYPAGWNGSAADPAAEQAGTKDGIPSRMDKLAAEISRAVENYEGTWSVYIRDLTDDTTLILHPSRMGPASMIKLFVMEAVFAWPDLIRANLAASEGRDPSDPEVERQIYTLLENMVVYSDNDSFNELIRLMDPGHDFGAGCAKINAYLSGQKYKDTLIQHTLFPSASAQEGTGETNYSSARDCGTLLERIFRGECVSEDASARMLALLLSQDNTSKIRSGLPDGVYCANKTGETASLQHDAGIIYGTDCVYILSIFSEGCPEDDAVDHIREITGLSYSCLNDG